MTDESMKQERPDTYPQMVTATPDVEIFVFRLSAFLKANRRIAYCTHCLRTMFGGAADSSGVPACAAALSRKIDRAWQISARVQTPRRSGPVAASEAPRPQL